jgi:predicted Zn-dependent peptidase
MSEKRGMFYDISGSSERYKNIGTLSFSYEVKERELYEAVRLTLEILNSVKHPECAAAEFVRAGYVDNAEMLLDDARDLNFTFAYDNHIMDEGYSTVEERRDSYGRITPERLSIIAGEVFVKKNLTLSIKCKRKRVDENKIKEIVGELL